MADEDKIQKQMEFIVEQQAHFATDIGQLKDIVARLANSSLQRIENLENKVSALVDAQIKTEANVSTLAEKMVELAEAQSHTDQRLNVLIDIISEGRNGKSSN
jgi:Txe/YoeB family toxin of Txe-Axe toxin-antitoxin module